MANASLCLQPLVSGLCPSVYAIGTVISRLCPSIYVIGTVMGRLCPPIYISGTVMHLMLNPSAMFWLETPVMITVQFCLFPVMITTDVPVGQRLLLVFDLDGRVGHALFIVILD